MANEQKVNPYGMTPAELAALLKRAGASDVGETEIATDVEAGAPTNADGTINLVHYTAWLVAQSR